MSPAVPPRREIGRLRRAIAAGRARVARIVGFNKRRRRHIAKLEAAIYNEQAVAMFDSTDVSQLPASAPAVAGYVNGAWPTFEQLVHDFPHAFKVSIDVNGTGIATILDVEPGDATNAGAAGWFKRRRSQGAPLLGFYTSVSNAPALIATLAAAGIKRSEYLLWTAHYTFTPHICGPHTCAWPGLAEGADATQWTDKALGRNLDQSMCHPHFFLGAK